MHGTKRTAADLVPRDHLHGLYIGFYGEYVPLWLNAFDDAIRVLFVEDMARDAEGVMSGVSAGSASATTSPR